MACVGVDVGSTTAKVVALAADARLLGGRCARHRGRPRELVGRLLDELVGPDVLGRVPLGVTGSIGTPLADALGAVPVHEVRAVLEHVRRAFPGTRTVVELGGQDAKLALLADAARGDDTQMNDRCAAGTGATIDRVAGRLGLGSRALRELRLEGDLSVAAKCGVFAETDVVNLVKRGATPAAAMSALLSAIVVQNLAVLARGRLLRPPVLLLGGPHAHVPALREAWWRALRALWRERAVAEGTVAVPAHAELFAAIGAASHARHGGRPTSVSVATRGRPVDGPLLAPGDDPRALDALRCSPPPPPLPAGRREVHVGVDAGSTTAKVVLLDADGELVAGAYGPSLGDPIADARARLAELVAQARRSGAAPVVRSIGVTGYGADLVGPALGADARPVETVAHVRAVARDAPDVEVVVDVGGTDVKVMRVEGGWVQGFHVSNQCSAGHGAFLAATAAELGVPIERFADVALAARRAPRFTVGCAIFVDTDRVTFQRDGFDGPEILAGLARALAHNVWGFVVPEPPERLGRRFVLTGGAQRNLAAAWAQASYLRERVPGAVVTVHPRPALCGAIGAALTAREAVAARPRPPASLAEVAATAGVGVRARRDAGTRCGRCELSCERTLLELPGRPERLVVGNACERGAAPASLGRRTRAHAPDLLAEEAHRLFRPLLSPPAPRPAAPRIVVGVPRVMGLYRSAPLLLHFLRAAGVRAQDIVLSPTTSPELFQAGARRGVTDPCFPSKLVLSHVEWLLDHARRRRPLDALLLPALTHARIAVRGTADTASCPIVAASGHTTLAALGREEDTLGRLGIRPLVPELCVLDPERLWRSLHACFSELLALDERESRAALAYALRAQGRFHERCRRRGARVLRWALAERRAVAVVLARPYHADPGVQHGLSTELAARGIPVLGISSLPTGDERLLAPTGALPLVTNSGCAEKLWASRVVRATPNLLAVDLSSFRCGQDASILGLLTDALGDADKPALRLHDLDEDRPGATFDLRVRTFVESARRYERETLGRSRHAEVRS